MKKPITFLLSMVICVLLASPVKSQITDPPQLIFSEINQFAGAIEFTNVDDEEINLSSFQWGSVHDDFRDGGPLGPPDNGEIQLPDTVLQPGETFVAAYVKDYAWKTYPYHQPASGVSPRGLEEIADLIDYGDEPPTGDQDGMDMINDLSLPNFERSHRNIYLEYHEGEGDNADSVLVDLVCITLDTETGDVYAWPRWAHPEKMAMAGEAFAYGRPWEHIFIRKTTVTQGQLDWDKSRGTDAADSEWILYPMRLLGNPCFDRTRYFTTLGHHDETDLGPETVSSDVIDIDWDNNKMTVPFGILADSIMDHFEIDPGISWHYEMKKTDGALMQNIAVTGDTLALYAAGAQREEKVFAIEQAPPADDMAEVFAKNTEAHYAPEGFLDDFLHRETPYYVTSSYGSTMDSIVGMEYATRVDTMMKYLDKAPEASTEIIWVDGIERADLKWGDILKVTAKDETVKEYFLAVDSVPEPSHNANLYAITWPDAPSIVKERPDWNFDTIPEFNPNVYMYEIEVPFGTSNVPALVPVPDDLNAEISVDRATRVRGAREDRTTTFTVTAEDDTTINNYSVVFVEEKPDIYKQPLVAEPFISEVYTSRNGNVNSVEIFNPGTESLDLSDYMLAIDYQVPPGDLLRYSTADNYDLAYKKYVPGYKYVSEEEFAQMPRKIVKDFAVNPIIDGGDTWVMTGEHAGGTWFYNPDRQWGPPVYKVQMQASDLIITSISSAVDYWLADPVLHGVNNATLKITEHASADGYDFNKARYVPAFRDTWTLWLFKIKNDSIKQGKKGIVDIADFELIDLWGDYAGDGAKWSPGYDTIGMNHYSHRRKPEFYKGNPLPGVQGSWDTTDAGSEWISYQHTDFGGEPENFQQLQAHLGVHSVNPITDHISTITSEMYIVSNGYQTPQDINGIVSGTTVEDLINNKIKKENEGQSLEVVGKSGDTELEEGDTLMVESANGRNVTKYGLHIGALDDNAVLTSSEYTISIDGSEGAISGIPFGTTVIEVYNNVNKPSNAVLNVIDADGNLVPMQTKNKNNEYVNTKAGDHLSFEVVAEDMQTKITYELALDVGDDMAYIYSDVYVVDQEVNLVSYVPLGTSVSKLLDNIMANEGAVVKVFDKYGNERSIGDVYMDDNLIITSPDGSLSKIYFLHMLQEAEGTEAYIVSESFAVNQLDKVVSGISTELDVNLFSNLVTSAPGATMMVLDADGNEKTSGDIANDDQLQVVSGNGMLTVTYDLNLEGTEAFVTSDVYLVNQKDSKIREIPQDTELSTFIDLLIPAVNASIEVLDANDNPVSEGMLQEGYKLKVVSGDEQTTKVYSLEYKPEPDLLVLSDHYVVNQSAKLISMIPAETSVSKFIENLNPTIDNASLEIMDANDQTVTEGDVTSDYKLKVTSGDQEVTYDLTVVTSISLVKNKSDFRVYPNPANDVLYVDGVTDSGIIVIRNILGEVVKTLDSSNIQNGSITLSNLNAGVYFIYLQTDNYRTQIIKIVKQ